MTPRKIVALIAGSIIGLLTLSWIGAGLYINTLGKSRVETYLQRHYGIDAKISEMNTNFWNAATLKTVTVTKPATITIGIARAQFHPINYFFSAGSREILTVNVSNAALEIPYENQRIGIKKMTGRIGIRKRELFANLAGDAAELGLVDFKSHLQFFDGKAWEAEFVTKNTDVRTLFGLVPDIKIYEERFNGSVQLEGNLSGNVGSAATPPPFKIIIKNQKLNYVNSTTRATVPLRGHLEIIPGSIQIHKLIFGKATHLNGVISNPKTKPWLELNVNGSDVDIVELVKIFPINPPDVNGTVSFDAHITGTTQNPVAKGTFQLNPIYAGYRFPGFNGHFNYSDDGLQLESSVAEGKMRLNQSKKRSSVFHLNLENLSLASFGKSAGWKNVSGRLNSELSFNPTINDFNLTGGFSLAGLQWGRQKKRERLDGDVLINGNNIALTTSDDSFVFKSFFHKASFDIQAFKLDFGDGSIISGAGRSNLKEKSLSFKISAKNLPPDLWPPLVARYPNIEGGLDLDGTLKGTTRSPQADVNVIFHGLQFIPTGHVWNGDTNLTWDGATMALKNIQMDGGYAGDFSWLNKNDQNTLRAQLQLHNADPRLVADVLKSTLPVSGAFNGQTIMNYEQGRFVGVSSITWANGSIGQYKFDRFIVDLKADGPRLMIEQAELHRKTGLIRARGTLIPSGESWTYNFLLQPQQWNEGGNFYDGQINISGTFNSSKSILNARVTSPIFWINDYAVRLFTASLEKNGLNWDVLADAKDQIAANLKMHGPDQILSGTISVNPFEIRTTLGSLVPRLKSHELPQGIAKLVARVSGRRLDPNVALTIDIPRGEWRHEPFSANSVVNIDSSTIRLSKIDAQLDHGGAIAGSGNIFLNDKYPTFIQADAKAVPLTSAFNFLNHPMPWPGVANGRFTMSGETGARELKFAFNGHHDGFGPFSKGGEFSGIIFGKNGTLNFDQVVVRSGNGYVKLMEGSQIFLEKNNAGKMRLIADVRNLETGLLTFFGGIELTGSWAATANGEIDPDLLHMDVFARSFFVNQFPLDGNVTHFTVKKGRVIFSPIIGSGQQIEGELDYQNYPALTVKDFRFFDKKTEKVSLRGLLGPEKWDFWLNLKEVDADILRSLFDTTLPMSGPVEAQVRGHGNIASPILDADVTWRNGYLGILPLDFAKGVAHLKNKVLRVEDIYAQKKNGYQLKGRIELKTGEDRRETQSPMEVDLTVTKGDFALLQDVWPDCRHARGSFDGRFVTSYKDGLPTVKGFFNAQKVSFQSTSYIPSLDRGELRLRFDHNTLLVDEAHAIVGKGETRLTGNIEFAGAYPKTYNLNLKTTSKNGMTIRVPELSIQPGLLTGLGIFRQKLAGYSRGEPTLDISLSGSSQEPTLSGQIWMENTYFTYPPNPNASKSAEKSTIARMLRSFRDKVLWNIYFIAANRTWYQNESVDARIGGKIALVGPTNDLEVRGRITTDQGSIVYFGNEFKIRHAELEISTAPVSVDYLNKGQHLVYLAAEAEKDVFYTDGLGNSSQDTIIMKVDRSLLGEIQPRFYSKNNPSLSSQRALQLALGFQFGESIESDGFFPGQSAQSNKEDINKQLRVGLVGLLDSSLASPLARALARETGLVDYIRVTYQDKDPLADTTVPETTDPTKAGSSNPTQNQLLRYMKGTKVKLGRELTRGLFADYSFRVDEYQNQLDLKHQIELAYRLRKNLFLRGISELDTERTLGRPPDRRALIENQWRFGLPHLRKSQMEKASTSAPDSTAQPPERKP